MLDAVRKFNLAIDGLLYHRTGSSVLSEGWHKVEIDHVNVRIGDPKLAAQCVGVIVARR